MVWSDQEDRLLLAHHGKRLHWLCKKMRALPISCKFYSSTFGATPSNCGILAIWRLGTWCCGPYHSKIFYWPLVHLGNNWLTFQMCRSNPTERGQKRKCCWFYSNPYHLPIWRAAIYYHWQWQTICQQASDCLLRKVYVCPTQLFNVQCTCKWAGGSLQ